MIPGWQDYVFALGSVGLAGTLIPTLLNSDASVPRWTSVPTAFVLYVFSATYLSMSFFFSAIVTVVTAVVWTLIALYRVPEGN